MTLTIGMTYDLKSQYLAEGYDKEEVAEFDSDETIEAIEAAIRAAGYPTDRIGHGRSLCQRLVAGDRWDLVFNIAEGWKGRAREAQVPCLLELYNVHYTFSDPLICALTLDKALAKQIVRVNGINTPNFGVVAALSDLSKLQLAYPLFAKPIAEGTGKGIDTQSKIASQEQLAETCTILLQRFEQPVLVEEYLPGREFTVGILGTGSEARVLGTMEISINPPRGAAVYSYEIKANYRKYVRYSAVPEPELLQRVEALALASYRTLQCCDGGRVDIRLDTSEQPSFMEVNPLPGLHPIDSDLPIIAGRSGMSYNELINEIIRSALRRKEMKYGL